MDNDNYYTRTYGGSKCKPLTKKEKKWIESLQKLALRCPPKLWLFSASSSLVVMKTPDDGEEMHPTTGGVNRDNIVGEITGIRNDGGDW